MKDPAHSDASKSDALRIYSMEEVEQHDTRESAWFVHRGQVRPGLCTSTLHALADLCPCFRKLSFVRCPEIALALSITIWHRPGHYSEDLHGQERTMGIEHSQPVACSRSRQAWSCQP